MKNAWDVRSSKNFHIPKYNIEYSKKRFSYGDLKAWKEIPYKSVKNLFDELKINPNRPPGRSSLVVFFGLIRLFYH